MNLISMKKYIGVFALLMLFVEMASAQYVLNSTSNGTTVNTCSGTFYDSGGSGSNYSGNQNYTITFCATSGCIMADFTAFNTQAGNDVLSVYDGSNTSAPLLGTFSGNSVPADLVASSGCLTFKFVSNNSQNKSGWAISLSCVTCNSSYNMNNTSVSTCDANFYDSGGPSGQYNHNENFVKTFTSNNSTCLQVEFTSFSTQSGKDTLTIFDGASTSATRIGVWSGTTFPPRIISTSGSLTFRFKTDGSNRANGWAAIISCVTCPTAPAAIADYTQPTSGIAGSFAGAQMVNDCGFTFTDDGGTSSNYSNGIGNYYRTFCPETGGTALRVSFWSFATQSGVDELSVLNGATQNSPEFGSNSVWSGTYSSYAATMAAGMGPYISTDQSGCLTFRFYSSTFTNAAGWVATIDCVPFPSAPVGTENFDCIRATTVCDNQSITDASFGPGLSSDITAGCIPTENYTNWYAIKVVSGGKLGFTLVPNTSTDDYDFAFYGPYPNCGTLGSPVRCSYAANWSTYPNTGMNSTLNLSTNTGTGNNGSDQTEGAEGNGFADEIAVNAGETYLVVVSKWSPGGNGFALNWILSNGASLDCAVPLPIELLTFNAEPENSSVRLNWITTTEINNDYFEIERSSNGSEFIPIHKMRGGGTSTQTLEYNLTDFEPLTGTSYYRLKQVDFDGKFTYSDILPVKFAASKQLCTIQPNPATANVEVVLYISSEKVIPVRIMNAMGAIIFEKEWSVHEGINRLPIDVAQFAKGVYFVTLENGPEVSKLRLVKE